MRKPFAIAGVLRRYLLLRRKLLQNFSKFGKVLAVEFMKYLAFDIEAANGYQLSSICSIGIVIADESFNIISSRNIWINPKTKYNLNGTRENVGINLQLDKNLIESSPDFSHIYGSVKKLLTDKRYTVIGHAVDSDVRMLNAACARYRLPSINFEFVCTQLLYKMYKGDKEVKALNKIADDIGVTFVQHNSEQDAYASMLTLRYLVQNSGLSVGQLLDKYKIRKGSNNNFELTRPVSLLGQVSKRKVTQVALEKIREYAASVRKTSDEYVGKVFCLARSLELSDGELLYRTVESIVSRGGRYVTKLFKCNVYVCNTSASEQDIMREKRVDELCAQGVMLKVQIDQVIRGEL